MSHQRFYEAGDDNKPEVIPAFWFLVHKKRRPAHLHSGRTSKVKAALKRIEAEMLKAKKGKMAC